MDQALEIGTSMERFEKIAIRKEEYAHGALLLLCEILRISNRKWESTNRELENNIIMEQHHQIMTKSLQGRALLQAEKQRSQGIGPTLRKYYQSGWRTVTSGNHSSAVSLVSGGQGSPLLPGIPFSWFGTVQVGKEPIVESALCQQLLTDNYEMACSKVIALFRNSQNKQVIKNMNPDVQNALLVALPKLAAFK